MANIHTPEREEAVEASEAVSAPRLTVILHPNPSRIDIALNDRFFNRERYSFSRKQEAQGDEKALLDYCENYIVGIDSAKASKNTLRLEINDGVMVREFIPQVITAIKRWGGSVEPYEPAIYVENRRWEVEPTYDADGMYEKSPGLREPAGRMNIGVPYQVWNSAEA